MRYSIRSMSDGHGGGSRSHLVPRECCKSDAANEGSVNR